MVHVLTKHKCKLNAKLLFTQSLVLLRSAVICSAHFASTHLFVVPKILLHIEETLHRVPVLLLRVGVAETEVGRLGEVH